MVNTSFDVVVAGCGIAGLSAAVAARQNGATVAVLERSVKEERGGNTRYTEAMLRMKSEDEVADDFESHFAANSGGYLDPSLIGEMAADYENWPRLARSLSFVDPELVGAFSEAAGPTIKWLKSFGLSFDFLPTPFLTTCTTRMLPRGGGLAMVEALAAAAEKMGVTFFYETTAIDLEQSDEGVVTGLVALGPKHKRMTFRAKSVVLACGGFEGNPEMLADYMGPRALNLRPVARGGYYNKGEGIRMALKVGAASCGDFASYHAEPIDPRSGVAEPAIFIFPYGILVNKQGDRFVDEAVGTVDATYETVTRHIYEQSDGIAYVILDAKLNDVPNKQLAIRTDQPPIEGATLAELAGKIGVPAHRLEATVASYNAACRPGTFKPLEVDGLATEGLEPPKSNWARPIDTGPFIAYPIISANVFTFGGLKVNGRAQVVNCNGDPIPGLYAGGEVVGIYYKTYTGATSVLKGAVFGRLAGLDAARSNLAAAGREAVVNG
ncbi:FAD-dependent tricarballylate dehydrogenase TcuA [Rhodoligotrophos ferricapiens]|uniref:FAD-dependent tricarballylate dehydrogenase TcuA n=1 Tax=Rhodoligotrophos ferricapiens TaxID=3069264 RepID=UPI00315C70FD